MFLFASYLSHLPVLKRSNIFSNGTSFAYEQMMQANRPLKNVFDAADAREKQAKNHNLCVINEHFEPVFNILAANADSFSTRS